MSYKTKGNTNTCERSRNHGVRDTANKNGDIEDPNVEENNNECSVRDNKYDTDDSVMRSESIRKDSNIADQKHEDSNNNCGLKTRKMRRMRMLLVQGNKEKKKGHLCVQS